MSWLDSVTFNSDGLIPAIAQDQKTERVLMVAWMNEEALKLTAETKTAVYFSRSRQKLWHKGETSGHTQKVHSIRLDCDADVILLSVTQIGAISCHTGRESCFYRELDLSTAEPVWQTTDPVLKNPNEIYANVDNSQHSHSETSSEVETHITVNNKQEDNLNTRDILAALDDILTQRKHASPDSSYVASLYDKGLNKILEKVGEEAFEAVISAKDYQTGLDTLSSGGDDNTEKLAELKNDIVYELADVWFHTMVTLSWFNMSSDAILSELDRRFGLSGIEEKANR